MPDSQPNYRSFLNWINSKLNQEPVSPLTNQRQLFQPMKRLKIKPVKARENFDCTEFTTMSHNYIKCNVDNPFRANSQATVRYHFSNKAHFRIYPFQIKPNFKLSRIFQSLSRSYLQHIIISKGWQYWKMESQDRTSRISWGLRITSSTSQRTFCKYFILRTRDTRIWLGQS